MARRQRVEVDEEAIKQMMSGDIPRMNKESGPRISQQRITQPPAPDAFTETATSVAEKQPERVKTRKVEKSYYAELFLHKREAAPKRQTYVNQALYIKLTKILAVLDSDLTVPTFIDNVLWHHLQEYGDQINELYEQRFEKPL